MRLIEFYASAPFAIIGPVEWVPFLAPFHFVLLHLPIGFLAALAVLETMYWGLKKEGLRTAVFAIAQLNAVAAVVVATLGWLRAETGGYDPAILEMHRWAGTTAAALSVGIAGLLWLERRNRRPWRVLHRLALGMLLPLMMFAGHQGGNLTHGTNFLIRNAPEPFRSMLVEQKAVSKPADGVAHARFVEEVMPVLETRCMGCHGEANFQSGFRLDTRERAYAGGESGKPAIVPGDPASSHLVRVLLLPDEHPQAMPPAGLPRLSARELGLIIDWVRDGAPFVDYEDAMGSS